MRRNNQVTRTVRGRSGKRRSVRPSFDLVEERVLLTAYLVNSTLDGSSGSGTSGTLRYIIGQLDQSSSSSNTIGFDLGSGLQTITLGSSLPAITKQVTIDGYSEANSSQNTATMGTNAVILVQLDENNFQGLVFNSGSSGSVVDGLSIFDGSSAAIAINASSVQVLGNFLGVQADGSTVSANATGISVASGLTAVEIGGTALADRNLISGNSGYAVTVAGPASIQGNSIGTDATGLLAKGNQSGGIDITGSGVTVGGTAAGAGNTIAFNAGPAVTVDTGTNNPIQQNLIFGNGSNASNSGISLKNNGNSNAPRPRSTASRRCPASRPSRARSQEVPAARTPIPSSFTRAFPATA